MTAQSVFFRHNGVLKRLTTDEIVVLEAKNNYIRIYAEDGKLYMIRTTLEKALSYLPEKQFLRIHRSFAVSVDHIDYIGKESVMLREYAVEVPASRKFYPDLVKKLVVLDAGSRLNQDQIPSVSSPIFQLKKKNGQ